MLCIGAVAPNLGPPDVFGLQLPEAFHHHLCWPGFLGVEVQEYLEAQGWGPLRRECSQHLANECPFATSAYTVLSCLGLECLHLMLDQWDGRGLVLVYGSPL